LPAASVHPAIFGIFNRSMSVSTETAEVPAVSQEDENPNQLNARLGFESPLRASATATQ